jgi:hypothetical protein
MMPAIRRDYTRGQNTQFGPSIKKTKTGKVFLVKTVEAFP